MVIKLLFIIALIILYFILKNQNKEIYYFYLTIILLGIRELNVPYLGDVTPATIMVDTMFLANITRLRLFTPQNIPFLITLIIGILIGLFNVPDIERMLNWNLLLFNTLILSSLTKLFISTKKSMRTFMKCIIATCLIFSITTIIGYLGLGDGTIIYNGHRTLSGNVDVLHSSRVYGISTSNLVQIIAVIIICLIPVLKIRKKHIEYIIIGLIIFSALITLKRMTFIALILALIYYTRHQVRTGNYNTLFTIVIISSIMIFLWWEPIMHRFGIAGLGETNKMTDHSTQSRLDRIGFAIAAFKQSPLFGMGAGYVTFVHNGLFEILGNCGIIGLLTFFFKFTPKIKDISVGNPWAIATSIYIITCFSLESAINHAQIIYFLGIFVGGYIVSTKYKSPSTSY